MRILGINSICKWVQIVTSGRRYTCPTKEINGVLCFLFKKNWHKVSDFTSDLTSELVSEGGKTISRMIKK